MAPTHAHLSATILFVSFSCKKNPVDIKFSIWNSLHQVCSKIEKFESQIIKNFGSDKIKGPKTG